MKAFLKLRYRIAIVALLFTLACGKEEGVSEPKVEIKVDIEERISKASFVRSIDYYNEVQLDAGVKQVDIRLQTKESKPIALYILEVDLSNPAIAIRAATPDDSEVFKLQEVSAIAAAADKSNNRVIAAVNADFFYWTGEPWGPVVKREKIVKDSFHDDWHGFFGITKQGNAVIGSSSNFLNDPESLREAVGGEYRLINNGSRVSHANSERNPRTIVGFREKTVYIMVVDGRQPEHSVGMTLYELSEVMFALRVKDALNLDGGGSSTLVVKNKANNNFEIKNKYSDENPRAVANALVVVNTSN